MKYSTFREVFSTLLYGAFLVVFVTWLGRWLWSRRKLYVLSYQLPGPFALPLLGNALVLGSFGKFAEMNDQVHEWKMSFGEIFRLWVGPDLAVVLSSPKDFECVMMNKETSSKGSKYDLLKLFIGEGLLTLSGPKWRDHRHVINPAFSAKNTRSHGPIFNECAKQTVESMLTACDKGLIDVVPYCARYSADVVTRSLFDLDFKFYNGETDFIIDASAEKNLIDHERMRKIWLLPDFTFKRSSIGKRLLKLKDDYTGFCYPALETKVAAIRKEKFADILRSKECDESQINGRGKSQSIFAAMMDANFTSQELQQEFNNIFNTGLDTIYSQVSSFILMMGMHKDCQDKVWQEIRDTVGVDPDCDITPDLMSKFPYLDMALKETVRVFPSGPIMLRNIHTDFYLRSRDILIPAGTTIALCALLLFNDPKYWKDPESFNPDRFLPEESARRPHFAFVPFSAGKRKCIGQLFGIDGIKTLAIQLISNFEFHSDLKMHNLRKTADISTRCRDGYFVKISRRNVID